MSLGDWLILAGALLLAALVTLACLDAHRSARRADHCREQLHAAVQTMLVVARAELDHDTAEKLAAGVTWSPRDHLRRAPKTAARAWPFPSSARPGSHPPTTT